MPAGQSLTIGPGVIIKMGAGFSFTVNGTLVTQGTAGSPVYITSLTDDSVGGDNGGDGASQGAPILGRRYG